MKKGLLFIVLLLIGIMMPINGVSARQPCGYNNTGGKIVCASSGGLGQYLATFIEFTEMRISYFTHAGANAGYGASEKPLFKIHINNALALCTNSNASYPVGQVYRKVTNGSSANLIGQIYAYSKRGTKEYAIAQILVWAAGDAKMFTVGQEGTPATLANLNIPDFLKDRNKFIDEFKEEIHLVKNNNTGNGGSLLNPDSIRYYLPDRQNYLCLWAVLETLNKGETKLTTDIEGRCLDNPSMYKGGKGPYTITGDTAVIRYKVDENDDDRFDETTFTKADYANLSLVIQLYGLESPEARKNTIANYFAGVGQGRAQEDNQAIVDAGDVYDAITSIKDIQDIAMYCPAEGDGLQCIIAPDDDDSTDLDSTSCSNYLKAMRDLGWSDDEIWSKKSEINGKATGDLKKDSEGNLKCSDAQDECVSRRTKYLKIKSIYVGHSVKLGDIYKTIFMPYSEGETLKCPCDQYAEWYTEGSSKIPEEYRSSCAKFREYYSKIAHVSDRPKDIEVCNDSTKIEAKDTSKVPYARCGDTRITGKKCNDLVNTAEWQGNNFTQDDLERFKNLISDKDKAKLVNGKIVCGLTCLPKVDPAYCCDKLGTNECAGDEIFNISDAADEYWNADESCYKNDVAYSLDDKPENTVKSKDEALSQNPYCDVYCWESVRIYFPQEPQITHGEMYFWGTNYGKSEFAHGVVHRICWTGKIEYAQYEKDWADNEAVITNKATWYSVYKSYIDDNTFKTESATCSMSCPSGYDGGSTGYGCCMLYKPGTTVESGNCATGYTDSSCAGKGNYKYNYGGKDPSCSGCPSGWSDDKGTCKKTGEKYTRSAGSGDFKVTGETGCYADKPSDADIDKELDGKHTKDFADVKSALQSALKKRTSMHNNLKACQMVTDSNSSLGLNANTAYDYSKYKMTVKDYTLKDRGVTNYDLSVSASGYMSNDESNVPNGGHTSVTCHDVSDDIKNDSAAFATNVCYDTNGTMLSSIVDDKYNEYNWYYTGDISFQYTNHFNLVAIMDETPTVISEDAQSTYERYEENGCVYERKTMLITRMDAKTGRFDVGVEISGLGNAGHFNKILDASKSDSYAYIFPNGKKTALGDYVCGAFGTNEFYYYDDDVNCVDCDKGIDVVYRLIEMASGDTKKIFPGKDGKSRKIGSNWSSFINEKYRIFSNITNKKYVYDNTPLYSIDLTPTLISEIRSSNKSYRDEKLNPYTSRFDTNNNLKIKCNKDNTIDKSCISSYITELIVKGKIKGRFAEKDESARINLISKYKTCYDTDKPNC